MRILRLDRQQKKYSLMEDTEPVLAVLKTYYRNLDDMLTLSAGDELELPTDQYIYFIYQE